MRLSIRGQKGAGRFVKLCVLKEHVFLKNRAELDPQLFHNTTENKRVIFHHQNKVKSKGKTVFHNNAMNNSIS
jgi:hypothetical protein